MSIRMSGLSSGMDTESIVEELMSAQRLKATKIENKITTLEWKQEKWKDLNSKIYTFYTGSLAKLKLQGSYQTKKASSSDEGKVEVTASSSAAAGTHKIQVKSVASAQFVTGSKIEAEGVEVSAKTKLTELGFNAAEGTVITIQAGENDAVTLSVDSSTTINDFVSACSKAGLNASYDTAQNRFFISSKESGYKNAFSITSETSGTNSLSLLGLSEIISTTGEDGVVNTTAGDNVSLVGSSDACVIYNGAELTSSSNSITANGLTFTVKDVTEGADTPGDTSDDETVSITVTNDAQAVYDMITDFVKSYNELLEELNDAYYADTAKGYEPLTDDQKETMTDDQIEKWETKIKSSLLRRDSSAGSLINAMRYSFSTNVKVDDKIYSLAESFGVVTTDYTEKGQLHIYGDTEDAAVSANADRLMKAITDDPEGVAEVFTTLAGSLYDTMTEKMASTELNSALTFYNDKEMNKTLEKYQDDLDVMEDRLADMENRYYQQFTAMEVALSKLNSQSSYLSSMLGTNTDQ